MFRDRGTQAALGLAAELGFAIACPLLACVVGGAWADQQLGTKPWLVLAGIVGGMVLAFGAIYNLVKTPLSGRRQTASAAPGAPITIEGARPAGNLQVRLNNALDDFLARLEQVGDTQSLARARQLRSALAPDAPDLSRLVAIQSYFAAAPAPVRDAADTFFADPVVTEILARTH